MPRNPVRLRGVEYPFGDICKAEDCSLPRDYMHLYCAKHQCQANYYYALLRHGRNLKSLPEKVKDKP